MPLQLAFKLPVLALICLGFLNFAHAQEADDTPTPAQIEARDKAEAIAAADAVFCNDGGDRDLTASQVTMPSDLRTFVRCARKFIQDNKGKSLDWFRDAFDAAQWRDESRDIYVFVDQNTNGYAYGGTAQSQIYPPDEGLEGSYWSISDLTDRLGNIYYNDVYYIVSRWLFKPAEGYAYYGWGDGSANLNRNLKISYVVKLDGDDFSAGTKPSGGYVNSAGKWEKSVRDKDSELAGGNCREPNKAVLAGGSQKEGQQGIPCDDDPDPDGAGFVVGAGLYIDPADVRSSGWPFKQQRLEQQLLEKGQASQGVTDAELGVGCDDPALSADGLKKLQDEALLDSSLNRDTAGYVGVVQGRRWFQGELADSVTLGPVDARDKATNYLRAFVTCAAKKAARASDEGKAKKNLGVDNGLKEKKKTAVYGMTQYEPVEVISCASDSDEEKAPPAVCLDHVKKQWWEKLDGFKPTSDQEKKRKDDLKTELNKLYYLSWLDSELGQWRSTQKVKATRDGQDASCPPGTKPANGESILNCHSMDRAQAGGDDNDDDNDIINVIVDGESSEAPIYTFAYNNKGELLWGRYGFTQPNQVKVGDKTYRLQDVRDMKIGGGASEFEYGVNQINAKGNGEKEDVPHKGRRVGPRGQNVLRVLDNFGEAFVYYNMRDNFGSGTPRLRSKRAYMKKVRLGDGTVIYIGAGIWE